MSNKSEFKDQIQLLKRRLVDHINRADVEETCKLSLISGVKIPGKVRPIVDKVRREMSASKGSTIL